MRILRRKKRILPLPLSHSVSTRSIAPHFAELCGRLEPRTSQAMAERGLHGENPQTEENSTGLAVHNLGIMMSRHSSDPVDFRCPCRCARPTGQGGVRAASHRVSAHVARPSAEARAAPPSHSDQAVRSFLVERADVVDFFRITEFTVRNYGDNPLAGPVVKTQSNFFFGSASCQPLSLVASSDCVRTAPVSSVDGCVRHHGSRQNTHQDQASGPE